MSLRLYVKEITKLSKEQQEKPDSILQKAIPFKNDLQGMYRLDRGGVEFN